MPRRRSALKCPICLERGREKPFKLEPCGHSAHIACLNHWEVYSPICPVCRARVTNYANAKPKPQARVIDDYTQSCPNCGQYVEWDGTGCRWLTCRCNTSFQFTQRVRRPPIRTYVMVWLVIMSALFTATVLRHQISQDQWARIPNQQLVTEEVFQQLQNEDQQLMEQDRSLKAEIDRLTEKVREKQHLLWSQMQEVREEIRKIEKLLDLKQQQEFFPYWGTGLLVGGGCFGGVLSLFYFGFLRW